MFHQPPTRAFQVCQVPSTVTNAVVAVGVEVRVAPSICTVHPAGCVAETTTVPDGGSAEATIGDSAMTPRIAMIAHAGMPRNRVCPPRRIQADDAFRSTARDTRRAILVSKTIAFPSFSPSQNGDPLGGLPSGCRKHPPRGQGDVRISSCRFQSREWVWNAQFQTLKLYRTRFRCTVPVRERRFRAGMSTVFRSWAHHPFESRGRPQSHTQPTTFAGTPATRAWAGTSFVTTAPAATIALRPIVIPHRTVAFAPMDAPSSTRVGTIAQAAASARGYRPVVRQTGGPTKTPSPIGTPL